MVFVIPRAHPRGYTYSQTLLSTEHVTHYPAYTPKFPQLCLTKRLMLRAWEENVRAKRHPCQRTRVLSWLVRVAVKPWGPTDFFTVCLWLYLGPTLSLSISAVRLLLCVTTSFRRPAISSAIGNPHPGPAFVNIDPVLWTPPLYCILFFSKLELSV